MLIVPYYSFREVIYLTPKRIPAVIATSLAFLTLAVSPVAAHPIFEKEAVISSQVASSAAPVVVGKPQGQDNATVRFIDEALAKKDSDRVTPQGIITERYAYSTYSVPYKTVEDGNFNVGPREQDSFLCSVPRGGTNTIAKTVEVSANLKIQSSVDFELQKVINIAWTSEASGSFKYTYSTTKVYTAPESVPNHRDYYGAIQYDLGSTIVNKTDVYHVYNGDSYMYDTSYTSQQKVYAKVPKAIEFSRDF